jgi:hypothetical protein
MMTWRRQDVYDAVPEIERRRPCGPVIQTEEAHYVFGFVANDDRVRTLLKTSVTSNVIAMTV